MWTLCVCVCVYGLDVCFGGLFVLVSAVVATDVVTDFEEFLATV